MKRENNSFTASFIVDFRINETLQIGRCGFQSLRYLGTICKVVISKHGHRWFASILVDTVIDDTSPEIRGLPTVGVDVGIKHLAVTSEGVYYENPKVLKRYERKLKRLQRQLSRQEKGSRNWHIETRK